MTLYVLVGLDIKYADWCGWESLPPVFQFSQNQMARPSLVFMENKKSTPTNSVLDNFIGVWDNVFDQEFCDFIINYIDNPTKNIKIS